MNLSDSLYSSTLFLAGRENAVASTKAFTTQVTVLALIVSWSRSAASVAHHCIPFLVQYYNFAFPYFHWYSLHECRLCGSAN